MENFIFCAVKQREALVRNCVSLFKTKSRDTKHQPVDIVMVPVLCTSNLVVLAGNKFKCLYRNSRKASLRYGVYLLRFLGAPVEQSVKLNIPRKTKLFVDQTFRERENAIRMHIVYFLCNDWLDLTRTFF